MSDLQTTSVIINGNDFALSVPFSKVDKERRMVHGFATLDNLDNQDDIVLYQASVDAFNRFRGNIREMHDNTKAVGKMVSFRPEKHYDNETGKVYDGILVSAYVSKGAQDTWEKVLDHTLTGFSIGGNIKKSVNKFDEETERVIRIIEKYDLGELSLVDNPANELATVLSFEKGQDAGYIANVDIDNVFFCRVHNIVMFSGDQSATCYECGTPMSNIGFVESGDPDKISVTKAMLANVKNEPKPDDFVEFDDGIGKVEAVHTSGELFWPETGELFKSSPSDPLAIMTFYEQNNDTMIKTNHRIIKNLSSLTKIEGVKKVDNETDVTIESVTTDPIVEETADISKAEDVVEPAVEASTDEVIEKNDFDELKEMLASITKTLSTIPDVLGALADSTKAVNERVTELEAVAKSAVAGLTEAQSENEKLGKRMESVEASTAFRKSADVGDIVQAAPEGQSIWGGRFLDGTTGLSR